MAKELTAQIKLQCPGGAATPAPPVGPALGAHGVPIGEFVKQFNDATADKRGLVIPVVISVFKDRSFSFVLKSPPAAVLLLKAAGLEKASGVVGTEIVGSVTRAQVMEIVDIKREDLNAASDEAASRIIEGTARSMGIEVSD
ncbi:MAG TPA: 50S ribosomal protein L11 [Planctomycetota bacterium]|jgi:large subunit ribosomal protein L11|nr:50S ribosomal protein L11 [Planctomycetota bacterium]MDP6129548.1 50S ribosomal protein L11 [Planctomycetota bacterium]MDP7246010.1 50S ribosomal protein L11 [Planctomycetota bacterium]MDP7561143.1 50S ribosomal protein L11 [Planctomycetota bacterium]HJM39662.1 50S ribosomal protein L11 [Planctomycetota bacterium]|tara:strand:+ start:33409 stop:33834 length:426 start_codon:yes stop_codon:yes gene_type:complete